MLELSDITFRYRKRGSPTLDGVSMTLPDGEIGILLGRNGSGKTTLFTNILGIRRPESGTMRFDGRDLGHISRTERAGLIAYVPQHIHFGALTVYDSILMGRVAGFGLKAGPDDFEVVERVMAEMGLEDYAERNAEELSGGEKQKIAIARAMAQEPKLLVFDEPTGNLDIANEQLILTEAKKLSRRKGISILSSLHDLNQAYHFGDRFFFLKEGKLLHSGGRESFTPELIREVFGIEIQILEVNGQKIIMGGTDYDVS